MGETSCCKDVKTNTKWPPNILITQNLKIVELTSLELLTNRWQQLYRSIIKENIKLHLNATIFVKHKLYPLLQMFTLPSTSLADLVDFLLFIYIEQFSFWRFKPLKITKFNKRFNFSLVCCRCGMVASWPMIIFVFAQLTSISIKHLRMLGVCFLFIWQSS